jgi:hypothetical protein
MMSDFSETDSVDETNVQSNVKKRKRTGRIKDVMKKLRASTNETGENCRCTRYKCFDVIPPEEQHRIIRNFNKLGDYNEQNQYLSGLITVVPVQRRRNRKDDSEANYHNMSYCYRVRVHVEGDELLQDVTICHKAFLSFHGITNRRVQTLKKQLCEFGEAQKDGRGKHKSRPNQLSEEIKSKVFNFIKSLKGRKSHYSLKDSSRVYLPEELNKAKLHRMYNEANKEYMVGLTTFCDIFDTKFNISFGYPRKDTCSCCDILKSEISVLEDKVMKSTDKETKALFEQELHKKETEKKVHLAKSEKFYSIKRNCRKKSRKNEEVEAITVDFQKNLPTPNITTSDVYYRRQLNFISFNIHILSDSTSVFYTYDESVARKGADDVCSMIKHFVDNILSPTVKHLIIFCDSCAGQNKNYTVIRFLHYLVNKINKFQTIKVVFPIRGHSYMEGDKDMSLINAKSHTETPDDWRDVIRNSRIKPLPFIVIDCAKEVKFETWTEFLSGIYVKKCPFPTRPIRVLKIDQKEPRLILHKTNYFGNHLKSVLVGNQCKGNKSRRSHSDLKKLYDGKLPIKAAKMKDLLHLKQFLTNPNAQMFYNALLIESGEEDEEFADDPPIDEAE